MSQNTAVGRVALSTYIKVTKVDGSLRYYRVVDGENTEITQEVYLDETGVVL